MTDRERLLALLDEWGVGYNGENAQRNSHTNPNERDNEITLCADDPKIEGYSGFFAVFEFADDGTFVRIAVWE